MRPDPRAARAAGGPPPVRRGSGRGARLQQFGWQVGCGTYGRLQHHRLGELLIETVRFTDSEAVVIDLSDGNRRIIDHTTASPSHRFAALSPPAAAALAGMPPAVVLRVGDMARRVDPFHSERHLSLRFRALTALIFERSLPCGFGLLKAAAGGWDGCYHGPHSEDPEQTAGNVSETLARHPTWTLDQAVRDQLARDSQPAGRDLGPLLAVTGWAQVLGDLDRVLLAYRDAPPYPQLPGRQPPPTGQQPVQLSLL